MPTEIGELIARLVSYPFVGVVIGAILTAYLIPKISKQWRKPKELELKMMVVSKMTETVTAIISAVYLDMVTELMDDENFKDAQRKWENDKEGVEAQLHVLFPNSKIVEEWSRFGMAIQGLIHLNLQKDASRREKALAIIQEFVEVELEPTDLSALIKKDLLEPGKTQYADAWLHLKELMKRRMYSIIDSIRKTKIADI
jgi:hypothetical protein